MPDIIEGFNERIRNIAVFAPLFELKQKRKYDYSLMELGIAVMLFILEDMLKGERGTTYTQIAYFLQDLINEYYEDDPGYEQALDLSHYLVRECLMNEGRPQQLDYLNLESGEYEEFKFHLIQLEDYEIEDKSVRLKLSTAGLELLFKTKEMYNELQVSISQLYLRQQIKKGVFDGALRSVEELTLAVKNEKQSLKNLEQKIIRDVLQVAKEDEYRQQMERIHDQLQREKELFEELEELISDTMDRYYQEKGEEEALDKIKRIKNRLVEVIELHESLFHDKLKIEKLMNESIENMILNAFNTKINFETEFLEPVVRNDLDLNRLKKILDPLFSVNVNSEFNPHRIFEKQTLRRKSQTKEENLWEIEEDRLREQEQKKKKRRREKEKRQREYLLLLLQPLLNRSQIKLSKIIANLKKQNLQKYQQLINQWYFYPFIMKLHQLGLIPLESEAESQGFIMDDLFWSLTELVETNKELAELSAFELRALEDVIRLNTGYVMSDFMVVRRDQDAV